MTKLFERKGDVTIMDRMDAREFDGKCEMCGKWDELRPYGPKDENICFDCMMKDEPAARAKFKAMLEGSGN